MLSFFRSLTINRQIQIAATGLVLIAFSLTTLIVYQKSSDILLNNVLHSQQSEVEAIAVAIAGRFESTQNTTSVQLALLTAEHLTKLSFSGFNETIGEQEVPELVQGYMQLPISGRTDVVDEIKEVTGTDTTIYVRNDNEFVSIVSSMKDNNNQRAIGIKLNSSHLGYQKLSQGVSFNNVETLFGQKFLTAYNPLYNVEKEIVGIASVAMPISPVMQNIFASLTDITWGKSGYTFVIDNAEKDKGIILHHKDANLIGTSILNITDYNGEKPFSELVENENGLLTYPWEFNGAPDEKFIVYATVPGWNWKIIGGTVISEVTEDSKTLLKITSVVAIGAAIMIVTLLSLLLFRILKPLGQLTAQVDAFGQGNISQTIENVNAKSHNEIHRLATGLSGMGHNLQGLVNSLRESGKQLDNTATDINNSADQSLKELSVMGEQTHQLASSIEEMAGSASSVAEQAGMIAEQATEAKQETSNSTQIVSQMVQSMEQLGTNLNDSATAIKKVEQQSGSIQSVTKMIDEIAEQTNLLALNAAIEAARAGEHGRGFAVVADEVRQLAHRTQNSVQEVVTIISKLQESTKDAVVLMDKSQAMGGQVNERVEMTGEAISTLANQVDTIAHMSESIATTAEQQSQVTNELAQGVTEVRDLSENNQHAAQAAVSNAQSIIQESKVLNEQVAKFS